MYQVSSIKRVIFIGLILLGVPFGVCAAGIQVSPSSLKFEIRAGEEAEKEIVVVNPAADVQIFEIFADEFSDLVKINVSSFTLEPNSKKTVSIKIDSKSKNKNPGIYKTHLSVIAKPLLDSRFQANTGVKIPVLIVFLSAGESGTRTLPFWTLYVFIVLIVGAAIILGFKKILW